MIPARPCRGILSKLRAAASLRIPTRDNPSRAQWASSASFSETLSMRRCGRCGAGAQEHGVDEGSGAGLALGPCLRWLQALTHVLLGSGAHVLLRCCDRVRAETAEQAAVRLARIRGAVWASPRALDERGLGQTRGQTRASDTRVRHAVRHARRGRAGMHVRAAPRLSGPHPGCPDVRAAPRLHFCIPRWGRRGGLHWRGGDWRYSGYRLRDTRPGPGPWRTAGKREASASGKRCLADT